MFVAVPAFLHSAMLRPCIFAPSECEILRSVSFSFNHNCSHDIVILNPCQTFSVHQSYLLRVPELWFCLLAISLYNFLTSQHTITNGTFFIIKTYNSVWPISHGWLSWNEMVEYFALISQLNNGITNAGIGRDNWPIIQYVIYTSKQYDCQRYCIYYVVNFYVLCSLIIIFFV